MLRRYCFIILTSFVFILNSCKSSDEDKKEISIGFSQCIDGDSWRKSMNHEMEVEASLHPEINLTIYNADRNTKKQIRDIEKMIKDKKDVIIVSPLESDSIAPVIEKANAKGIPVIIVDRKVNTSNYTTYIGTDNIEVGHIVGRHLVSLSKGSANIVEIKGNSDTSPGYERSLGFWQIVSQYPGIKVVTLEAEKDELPEAEFARILDRNPNINYIYAYNDIIAYQAWIAAKKKQREKNIKIIGVDGLNGPNGGVQLVKEGVLEGTVLYPTGGNEAIKLALKISNNEIVPKSNKLNTILIDSLNADILSNQFDKITIQQSDIEEQQNVIKEQEEKYTTQSNLLKLLTFLCIMILSLAIYSIYSGITIRRKKKELEKTNKKIVSQRNEIEKFVEEIKRK